jgi:hypothetical protein
MTASFTMLRYFCSVSCSARCPLLFRDVAGDHQHRVLPGKGDVVGGDFNVNQAAVFQPMLPSAGAPQPAQGLSGIFEQPRHIPWRADFGHAHAQKFLAGIAVVLNGCGVDFQKTCGLGVEHPHGLRVVHEQEAKTALVLREPFLNRAGVGRLRGENGRFGRAIFPNHE